MTMTLWPALDRAGLERLRRYVLALCVLVTATIVGGCESSSTTAVGADSVKCGVSLTTPPPVDPAGGGGKVIVTTQPECAWTVSSPVNWISGLSPASGQGTADVSFQVAPNDGSSARDGDIVVNDVRVRVSQPAPCRYIVSPANQAANAAGGAASVTVATASECAWNATTDAGWIRLTAPLTGSGNATVNVTVEPNDGNERAGSIIVAGQRATITQAPSCRYAIAPQSQSIAATGGAGAPVSVTTSAGCSWTATSQTSWIAITAGSSGTGNGSVVFTVAANAGAERTGTLTIAGHAFTVTQARACSYGISPTSQHISDNGGSGTVNVATATGCTWAASSSAAWITITSGATGTGNGTVSFTVPGNGGTPRSGTLTIAGQLFAVTQGAAPGACTYSISSGSQNVPSTGASGSVSVTTAGSCTWTATSSAMWITVTSGANGTGNGSVGFSVAANPGGSRTGTLTIAGLSFTVTQAGATSFVANGGPRASERHAAWNEPVLVRLALEVFPESPGGQSRRAPLPARPPTFLSD